MKFCENKKLQLKETLKDLLKVSSPSGKERYMTNTRVPLAAVCFVERSVNNHITQISAEQALPRLFSQVMITDSADLARQLELIDALLATVPTHLLHCNTDPLAARVAYEGMREDTVCN